MTAAASPRPAEATKDPGTEPCGGDGCAQEGAAGPGLDVEDWPSSGSDTLDVARIIQASDALRSRLAHTAGAHHWRSDSASSSASSASGIDPIHGSGLAGSSDVEQGAGPLVPRPRINGSLLQWNPGFLDEGARAGGPPAANVADADGGALDGCQGGDDRLYAIQLAAAERNYPLRKRSEKNLHPYTRLVWTNPDELRTLQNAHRRVLPLDDPRAAGPARPYAEQDDSEDEDYVPASPELAAAAADSQSAALDLAPMLLHSPHPRRGLTYHHLAARRRQQAAARVQDRGLSSSRPPEHALEWRAHDSDHLPSVGSLLGVGSSDPVDPYAFPESGELQMPAAVDHQDMQVDSDDQGLDLLPPLLVEPHALLAATAPPAHDPSTADTGRSPSSPRNKRRRLLSRRRLARARAGAAEDGTSSESSTEGSLLPTTRARRLGALSRRQIRGVLPFSFMRELDSGRREEIDEEIGRWRQRRHGGPARQLALPSSPPDTTDGATKRWAHDESDGDTPMGDGNSVARLFSDPATPGAQHGAARQPSGNPSSSGPQPRFRFNFMDVYEWQYPPLAPVELTGKAPDFLRVAARECRRRGIRAKAEHDDPELKAISIELRPKGDDGDEDVARGILLAWQMGVIDIRRVYFADDMDESDDLDACQPGDTPRSGNDWMHNSPTAADVGAGAADAIMVSDDEAAEDNAVYDRTGGGSSRPAPTRSRRASRRPKKQPQKQPWQLKPPGGARLLSGHHHYPRQAAAARGLDAVMHEFTGLDSDSEDGGNGRKDAGLHSRLPPLSLLGQHMARQESSRARQEEFVARFSRQRQGGQQRRRTARRSHAWSAAGQACARASGGRRVAGTSSAAMQAEFVFDDDDGGGGGEVDNDGEGNVHHRGAGIQVPQPRAKSRQTRLLPSRPAMPSAMRLGGPRLPAAGQGAHASMADAVADRLHKSHPGPRSASPGTAAAKQGVRSLPRARGVQRKAAPTRAYFDGAARRTAQPAGARAVDLYASDAGAPAAALSYFAGRGPEELRCLPSGTRFPSSTWIAQGGLHRVLRLLHAPHGRAAGGADTDGGYQYGDILRIDMAATPAEYGQALGMLFMLWHEKMAGGGDVADPAAEEDSVLRWTEFSQRLIVASSRSKPALAQIARRLVGGGRDALKPLATLASGHGHGHGPGLLLAAAVGLSYAVALLQVARTLAWARGAAAHMGPRAVGEEDAGEEALASLWTGAELAAEIDAFVAVVVRLLGAAPRGSRHALLGRPEQIWVVLIHTLSGDADGGGAAPVGGVWQEVLAACTPAEAGSRRQADNLWSAVGLLIRLAQINVDGVAAPRPAARLHRPLVRLAEAAVQRGLLLPGARDADALAPSEEAAVRQTFARVHSVAVACGLAIGAGSSLYMALYRHLESRQFQSLGIEPPPSLPRFFTRYSGTIRHESSVADSCTALWLKSLDASLADWLVQLRAQPQASRAHRSHLQTVRAAVSKMLPTRILTFTPSTPAAQLSTLANYYAVFLFFLHAIPGDVVRASRLATQFQALLRFRDSASQVARRVYFEAWSAAAMIVGLRLRRALEDGGNVGAAVAELVGGDSAPGGRLASACDCHVALKTVVAGWADSLGAVLDGLRAADGSAGPDGARLWALADAAFMYLHRVLASGVLAPHAPTVALVVLEVLRSPSVLELLVWDGSGGQHAAMPHWVAGVLQAWQDATSAPPAAAPGPAPPAAGQRPAEEPADGSDTQMLLDMVDSGDLLEAAAEADEAERRAAFMAADAAAVRVVHEQYVPRLRLHIMAMFTSLSAGAPPVGLRGPAAAALEATVVLLAQMVAVCVDGGLRTWESFLDEHGRDSLYLIPSWHGRRLVLAVFAVAAIDVIRARGQSTARLETLVKDVWFASACDLSLAPYVHCLTAQLQWMDRRAAADGLAGALAVFAAVPVDRGLLVEASGALRTPLGRSARRASDAGAADARLAGDSEHRAALAVSCIAGVLQAISQTLRDPARAAHAGWKQQLSSWVALLLSTQRQLQQAAARATHALADTRGLVDAMAERVTLLVRDTCAELFLPPNLMVRPR